MIENNINNISEIDKLKMALKIILTDSEPPCCNGCKLNCDCGDSPLCVDKIIRGK